MKSISRMALLATMSVSLLCCSAARSTKGSVKGNVTERMQLVVDNFVSAYNTLDSVNFRCHFGSTLLFEVTLKATGKLLRDSQRDNGKIEKVDIDASEDGRSAVVTLHMERQTYDVQLRLDANGRLTRFDWTVKYTANENSAQSGARMSTDTPVDYQKFAAKFVAAIRDSNLIEFYEITLFEDDSPDEFTIDDAAEMLGQLRGFGEITSVKDVETLSSGEISLPITFAEKTLDFLFSFSDVGDLSGIKITNYAPKESIGKTLADIGADTTYTADLHDLSELRDLYNADEGKVRFIALLSPT